MKVLYLNSGNLFGGIETLLVTLARHREQCPGMEPEFGVCFDGRYAEALRQLGVPVYRLGEAKMSRPWQVWAARRALRKVLREQRPNVVVCHGSWSMAVLGPAVRAANIPLVYWTHDRVTQPLPWQERWAKLTPPDFVIANSQYTAAGQTGLYPEAPLEVIYCALSPPARRVPVEEQETFRAAQETPPGACVILQVSRLDPHKGHRHHLEALGKLRGLPWVCWMVAGPQRPAEQLYLEQLKQKAADLGIAGQMRFLGWQKDIDVVMEAADIFCQPNSGPEPFGLTYVEALYRNKPVVTTAMAGALEVLTPECGRLVPVGDADALAEALRELVTNPELRQQLGNAGPARAEILCNPKARLVEIAERLQKVIEV